jgi:hypothetical protein
LPLLLRWLERHPGIFAHQDRDGTAVELVEIYSGKARTIASDEIQNIWERPNAVEPGQTYVIVLLASGAQLVLATQGFAFAPNFVNTGPLELPAPVLCMRDYDTLMEQLRHLTPDRGKQALELIMACIALLDGATAVGLDVGRETQRVESLLARVERGEAPDPTHG